jgi:hypothetical protein
MANNVYDPRIYEDMLAYRRFPDEMFTGSADWKERLRQEMAHPPASAEAAQPAGR